MADNKKSSISKRSSCYLLNLKQPDKTARRLKLSFQRTAATVVVLKADRHVEASVGFLDVSETGAGIYTPELLHKGAHVELSITEPAPLRVRGIVAWSIPVTSGIFGGKFRCRSGIQFVLDGEEQTKSVQEFVRKAGLDPVENFRNARQAALAAAAALSPAPDSVATPDAPPPVAEAVPSPAADAAPAPAADASPAAAEPVQVAPAVAALAPEVPPAPGEAAPAVTETAPVAAEGGTGTPDSGQQAA